MAAAGWAIDELQGQVISTPTDYVLGTFYYLGNYAQYNNYAAPTAVQSCKAYISALPSWEFDSIFLTSSGSYGKCTARLKSDPTLKSDLINVYQSPCSAFSSSQVSTCTGSSLPSVPVPDDVLYDSLITKMLEDPEADAQAFMVPDPWPYPYPEIFPDTIPYIPGVTQSDQELLDLYAQGLLQSTNPNAAHYVSPQKLAEIAALAGQLQQGLSPEAVVDAANQAAQAPVTQAQLEELMKKQEAAEAKADAAAVTQAAAALAPATTALDDLQDEKTELEGMITDAPTAQPPSSIPDIFDWTLPTGNCQPYPFTFTIQAGSAQADDDGAFCRTYNEVAHPLIFWFLNMLTAVYIFGIWSRTMTSVVGGR